MGVNTIQINLVEPVDPVDPVKAKLVNQMD